MLRQPRGHQQPKQLQQLQQQQHQQWRQLLLLLPTPWAKSEFVGACTLVRGRVHARGSEAAPCQLCVAAQEGFEDEGVVPLRVMPLRGVGHTFTILRRAAGSLPVGELTNILRFTVKEIDPSTGALRRAGRCRACTPKHRPGGGEVTIGLPPMMRVGGPIRAASSLLPSPQPCRGAPWCVHACACAGTHMQRRLASAAPASTWRLQMAGPGCCRGARCWSVREAWAAQEPAWLVRTAPLCLGAPMLCCAAEWPTGALSCSPRSAR